MNISFQTLFSNTLYYIDNKLNQFSPLQKKVSFLVIAYFSCAAFFYTFYRCYSFNAGRYKRNDDQQNDRICEKHFEKVANKMPKPKIIVKPPQSKEISPINDNKTNSLLPAKENQLTPLIAAIDLKEAKTTVEKDQTESIDPQESFEDNHSAADTKSNNDVVETVSEIPPPSIEEDLKVKEDIDLYMDQAEVNEDFLSLLRCMADHEEWVQANKEQASCILKQFGSQGRFLHPIKVIADLYERLLDRHPELAFDDSLKNTDVVFDNKRSYRTHLIFALKHLHVVKEQLDEEIPDISQIEEGLEIHLPGKIKTLKAILQYLDKSDTSKISKIRFFDLIQMAHQYQIASIWRYCEANISKKMPLFPKTSIGEKEWLKTLQLYADLKTQNVNFIIDHLLGQRGPFSDKTAFELFFASLPLEEMEKVKKQEFKEMLLKRIDVLLEEVEVVREEHEDRIEDALVILENAAERLTSEEDDAKLKTYVSCSSVNAAMKTLFKATIAKQFTLDIPKKNRMMNALSKIERNTQKLIKKNAWRPFEWDKDEAGCIPSLAVCLLNYLTQDVPEEIKKLPSWHGESLVLAFNDSANKKSRLSDIVIEYAENAVREQSNPGLYFLLRPSSRVASSKDSIIFTATFNLRNANDSKVFHTRIEAVQDPINKQWQFKSAGNATAGVPLSDFISTKAQGLQIFQVPAPKTSKKRVDAYIVCRS